MPKKLEVVFDISHKYGYEKGSKKVVLKQLKPYRMDVYKNRSTGLYYFVGIKYSDIKCEGGYYTIDEDAYNKILIKEKMIEEGQSRQDLERLGYEFCLTFYKNSIIEYEKKGIKYVERFLSRTMPEVKNYIETKPINMSLFEKQTQHLIGLAKTTLVKKHVVDILGNERIVEKEVFVKNVDKV